MYGPDVASGRAVLIDEPNNTGRVADVEDRNETKRTSRRDRGPAARESLDHTTGGGATFVMGRHGLITIPAPPPPPHHGADRGNDREHKGGYNVHYDGAASGGVDPTQVNDTPNGRPTHDRNGGAAAPVNGNAPAATAAVAAAAFNARNYMVMPTDDNEPIVLGGLEELWLDVCSDSLLHRLRLPSLLR